MTELLLKSKKTLLLIGDFICLISGLIITLLIRYGSTFNNQLTENLIAFSFLYLIWLLVFFIADLYELKRLTYNSLKLLSDLINLMIINGIIAVSFFYFLTPIIPEVRPQRILIINLIVSVVLLFLWRRLFYNFIKTNQNYNRVLIIGENYLTIELANEIRTKPQLGYDLILESVLPENLKDYCLRENINTIVTTQNSQQDQEEIYKIFECLTLGIDIYHINIFYELITQKIPVNNINLQWFLDNLNENSKKSYELIKRLMDVALAGIGLTASLPFLPIIALIIKLESKGPIIFKQVRTGKNGRTFLAMKFRSMVDDAEKTGAQWAIKNDPRVTKFGKIMRKTRLDEIPQLINILRNEMSLIGPRPERPEFVELLTKEIPFYQERLLIKPGLTGWAQLLGPAYGGSKEESLEKLKYDLYYIKNRSINLDINIILKTIKVVLGRKGQ